MQFDSNLEAEDFIIRVRPLSEGSSWDGSIDLSIITSADNPLDDESYSQIMHLCKMICATVPIMEQNEDMGEFVHDWVMENIEGQQEPVEEQKTQVDITHEDGNLVRLDFGTRTKGSA